MAIIYHHVLYRFSTAEWTGVASYLIAEAKNMTCWLLSLHVNQRSAPFKTKSTYKVEHFADRC